MNAINMAPTKLIKTSPEPGTVIHPVYTYTAEQQKVIEDLKKVCGIKAHVVDCSRSVICTTPLSIQQALLCLRRTRIINGSNDGLHGRIRILDI